MQPMLGIQERMTAFAMLGAGWVLWLLVALSVVGLAIVLERTYYMLATRDDFSRLRADVERALLAGDLDAVRRRVGASRAFEARVLAAGLARDDGPESVERRMRSALSQGRLQLERNLAFLGTVGNNAPFVGLLGTVIGIIRAFHALQESAGQVTSGLMAEIGEALVATAIGILVALPAVAAYNTFQRVIRGRVARAEALGAELLATMRGAPVRPAQAATGPAD
ncbi:MAG: MotA/TolQ/ExbB proton channel family protein [Myxococcota bacterium]|nr:MotA/TolQ/ExbB proton channel family protein [Myxococcota bacterium]MDW8363667.1 MotA/TolQ/ExbB proton channel family protein [Myxococcales bacterium]